MLGRKKKQKQKGICLDSPPNSCKLTESNRREADNEARQLDLVSRASKIAFDSRFYNNREQLRPLNAFGKPIRPPSAMR